MDAPTPVNNNTGTATSGRTVGGRYTLGATVGSGGMGTVWRAHDELLRRDVAVKEVLLPPGLPARERELLCERTLREARAAAALNHPAVVRVYDVVTDGDRPWIVMELLEAKSISEVLRDDGPMPVGKVAEMGLAVLGALEAAHRVGVLHRDVKPGNVLLGTDGRTTLTDFGVARSANESPLTSTGLLLGSPQYIAPERARGQSFGPASDLWSLGATLYTAVEGRAPFDRGDPLPTMTAVVCEPPDPVSFAGPLAPVLDGLLEKDPDQRWDAAKTRAALKSVQAGLPVAGSGETTRTTVIAPQQQQRSGRRGAGAGSRAARALEGTAAMEPLQDTGLNSPVAPASPAPASPAGRTAPFSAPPAARRRSGRHQAPPEPTQVAAAAPPASPRRTPSNPRATSVLPPGGAARHHAPPDVQRTAPFSPAQPVSGGPGTPRRAVYLQSPEAMRASAKGETSGIPNPGRVVDPRRRKLMMLAAAAVALVLVLGLGAYALSSLFGGPDKQDSFNGAEPKPVANVQLVDHQDDHGFTVKVPAGWEVKSSRSYTNFAGPGGRNVRLLVERAASSDAAIRGAKSYQRGQERRGNISNFQTVRQEPAQITIDGRDTIEWEWTFVNDEGQARRVLWRNTVVDGRSYNIYISGPDQNFEQNKALLDEITKSFRFTS